MEGSASAPPLPTAETYIPKHLAEKILTASGALSDERKQVTVLFADLKNSLELLADRDPEEARRILDPLVERMMDAVHRYEGTVNQVMGDGIMALFGAPLAHEDHAVRACYAALRMQEAARQYAAEIRQTMGLPIQLRIGLNSGEVVVRSIGSDLRMDYTAIGQTTHLAARMEQLATPGTILLAPEVLRLAEGYVQVQSLGPTAVKGFSEPIEVYELIGAGMARSRLQATAARGLTKFVGRDAELEMLRRTLSQAAGGHGQIVALVGEPGVGKSRLTWEFTHSHRTRGWLVLETRSVSYGKAAAYLPLIDLIKPYCGIEPTDDARRIQERLTGKLLTLDPSLGATLPAFLSLLDVPVDDPAWRALDPPQRRQRTLEACKRLLLRESQEQPLLLVFEDLHWIDSETQAVLDSLVDSLPTARVLLLVNYRPEYEHRWAAKSCYSQLRLDPLPPESAEELLQALLGEDASTAPLKPVLIERAEGNPFFLEECVRDLVESEALAGERGAYRLVKPFHSTQVPATIQAVLAARIDRLPPEDKRLLQCAAVIGKDVPLGLLQAVAELRESWLHQSLADLQASEFLYETSLFPEVEYTFKHALTHEVAYRSMLHERRRLVHARIVEAIEARAAGRLDESIELLAHHAVRGGLWEQAALYQHEAGRKAQARSANQEAVAHFESALEALTHVPESRKTLERTLSLRLDLRNSLMALGELGRLIDHVHAAEEIAEALGDQHALGLAAAHMASYYFQTGEHERAVAAGERGLALEVAPGDYVMRVTTNFALGRAYYGLGEYERAITAFNSIVTTLTGERMYDICGLVFLPSVTARGWLSQCYSERGDFAAGIAAGEEGVAAADATGHSFSLTSAYWGLGRLYLNRGDFDRAIALLQRGLEVSKEKQIKLLVSQITSTLGYAYALAGCPAQAMPLLEEGADLALVVGNVGCHSLSVLWLAEGQLLLGRLADARQNARRALELSRQRKEHGNEAWSLRLLGEIAVAADPPTSEEAEACLRQALAQAEARGMRPLVAHCHLGLGKLYRRVGRREEARAALATAAALYRAMEMGYWLTRAEGTLV